MIDDRTQNIDLPLPHQDNQLTEDVLRLRQALTAIDAKFGSLDVLLQSDDATLDQLQEIVNAVKTNVVGFTQQEEVQTLADGQTVVDMVQLASTAGCSVFIEGVRLNAGQWSRDALVPTRLTLSKSYPAGHSIAVVRQQGGA